MSTSRRPASRSTVAKRSTRSAAADDGHYVLRLYVSGATPRSAAAIVNLREVCDRELQGRYDLSIVDIYQQRQLAADECIVAVPTLIKALPLPLRRLVGDLSDRERVLFGMDLKPARATRRRSS